MSACTQCDARLLPLQNYCDHCGTPVKGAAPVPAEGSDAFTRLAADPALERALGEGPRVPPPPARPDHPQMAYILFAAVLGFAMLYFFQDGPPKSTGVWAIPLVALLPLLGGWTRRKGRSKSYRDAPLESFPARIQSVEAPSGSGRSSRATLDLVTRGGQRRRLRHSGVLWSELNPGDLGAAFVKADVLVDFRRVDVG